MGAGVSASPPAPPLDPPNSYWPKRPPAVTCHLLAANQTAAPVLYCPTRAQTTPRHRTRRSRPTGAVTLAPITYRFQTTRTPDDAQLTSGQIHDDCD